ncbi:hypothetical protein [Paenibacillus paridis]|uniref:hypothetical protein n=1 Tax=Paenibacillus paridis TaxID=2583376 RepID=UPI00111E46EF|nr:hypothetical protein [Paenibacillus paridis]
MSPNLFIKFEEAFPINSNIARWIVGLGIVHNDLVYISQNSRAISNKDMSIQITQLSSMLRIHCSSLREAIFYLEESEKLQEVTDHIKSLPQELQELYSKLTPLFRTGVEADLLQKMTNIRNVTYHFSKPNKNEFTKALQELCDRVVYYDKVEERFLFAEIISDTIMIQSLFKPDEIAANQGKEAVSAIISRILNAFHTFITFAKEVVNYYFKHLRG